MIKGRDQGVYPRTKFRLFVNESWLHITADDLDTSPKSPLLCMVLCICLITSLEKCFS